MKILMTILFCLLCSSVVNGEYPASNRAESIKSAYELLKKDCRNKKYQSHYITVFPKTGEEFNRLFYYTNDKYGELYDIGEEYVFVLGCVLKDQPRKVIPMLLTIAKTVPHGTDAITALRLTIIQSCYEKPDVFISSMRRYNNKELKQIINLLADEEGIKTDKEYQKCIDILKANRAEELANAFEEERAVRERSPNE